MPFGVPTASTTTTATNDNNIDGLLWGTKWASNSITYSFTDSIDDYESNYSDRASHASGFQTLNITQRAAARSWFQQFSSVSGLTFTELTGASDRDATIRMAMSPDPASVGAAAYAYLPGNFVEAGDAWFSTTSVSSPIMGNRAYRTFGHELGHALGLKHGQETGGVRNVAMNADRDSMEFSIMTYRSHVGHPGTGYTNETWGFAQSLMMYDIAAIQHLYGANFNSNSTNTVYSFSITTGEMFINGVGQGVPGQGVAGANRIFRTIWDGNGIDTYNFSNYTTNLAIDLTPGGWTDLNVGGNFQRAQLNVGISGTVVYARGHVFNALQYQGDVRSLIENANGGSGNDNILGNNANNTLNGNGGNDNIDGGLGNDIINGGDGNDTLDGSGGNDTINGGAGTDNMNGGTGIDTLSYVGSTAGVTVNLNTNTVTGGHATGDIIVNFENVTGSIYNDILSGNAGANVLLGGFGNDTINGGAGADTLNGGFGIDTLSYTSSLAGVFINLTSNIASGGHATGDIISEFENVTGSIYNDILIGTAGANVLSGGMGNDTIGGGAGADTLNGGTGIDTLTYGGSNAGVLVDLAINLAMGGFAAGDIISNFENVTGSIYNDTLVGNAAVNVLFGGAGNDTIAGGAGGDNLNGGDGIDTLSYSGSDAAVIVNLALNIATGGFATGETISNFENVTGSIYNDVLFGSIGANVLAGGAGKDVLSGGGGNDKFSYSALSDSLLANYDVITDYGVGDQIDAPFSILAANLITSVGTAASLNAAAISAVLTSGVFAANSARAFTVSGMSGTFVALNNGVAGFEATTDGIIYLQNYAIGAASPVAIV